MIWFQLTEEAEAPRQSWPGCPCRSLAGRRCRPRPGWPGSSRSSRRPGSSPGTCPEQTGGKARWSSCHICLWILTLADSTTFSTRMMALRAASSPLMRAPAFSTTLVSWASGIRMSTSRNAWWGKVQIRVSFNIVKASKLFVFLPQQMNVRLDFASPFSFLWRYIFIRKRERQYFTIHATSECGKFAFAPCWI